MDDDPNIAVHSDRPEAFIPYIIEHVKTHTRMGRIDLEIKVCGFNCLLLVTGEFGEAVGESVGDAKIHMFYLLLIFGPT